MARSRVIARRLCNLAANRLNDPIDFPSASAATNARAENPSRRALSARASQP